MTDVDDRLWLIEEDFWVKVLWAGQKMEQLRWVGWKSIEY